MPCKLSVVLLVLSLTILTGGCRRVYTFVPVEGTITKNGKPLAGAQVIFYADRDSATQGPQSSGTTDANGHYRLQTDRGDDGAVAGQHRVCIFIPLPPSRRGDSARFPRGQANSSQASETKALDDAGTNSALVPPNYGLINETPLRAEVRHGGKQTIDFDIP